MCGCLAAFYLHLLSSNTHFRKLKKWLFLKANSSSPKMILGFQKRWKISFDIYLLLTLKIDHPFLRWIQFYKNGQRSIILSLIQMLLHWKEKIPEKEGMRLQKQEIYLLELFWNFLSSSNAIKLLKEKSLWFQSIKTTKKKWENNSKVFQLKKMNGLGIMLLLKSKKKHHLLISLTGLEKNKKSKKRQKLLHNQTKTIYLTLITRSQLRKNKNLLILLTLVKALLLLQSRLHHSLMLLNLSLQFIINKEEKESNFLKITFREQKKEKMTLISMDFWTSWQLKQLNRSLVIWRWETLLTPHLKFLLNPL